MNFGQLFFSVGTHGTLGVVQFEESRDTPPRCIVTHVCILEVCLVAQQVYEEDSFLHLCSMVSHFFPLCLAYTVPAFVTNAPRT